MDLQKGMTPKEKRADNREADRRLAEELKKQRWDEGFSKMDSRILAEIPDDYLADLQSKFDQKSAVYIRAQQEWQRRLVVDLGECDRRGARNHRGNRRSVDWLVDCAPIQVT